ncbi:hypothetical protein GGR53DRAFT_463108 [Hypoxylon sp. FL1150]|nr:hypothetical protein GGR53DRAFT_463108 [Hypoxylon sp. FL1150]
MPKPLLRIRGSTTSWWMGSSAHLMVYCLPREEPVVFGFPWPFRQAATPAGRHPQLSFSSDLPSLCKQQKHLILVPDNVVGRVMKTLRSMSYLGRESTFATLKRFPNDRLLEQPLCTLHLSESFVPVPVVHGCG